jgi:hypothetical protein
MKHLATFLSAIATVTSLMAAIPEKINLKQFDWSVDGKEHSSFLSIDTVTLERQPELNLFLASPPVNYSQAIEHALKYILSTGKIVQRYDVWELQLLHIGKVLENVGHGKFFYYLKLYTFQKTPWREDQPIRYNLGVLMDGTVIPEIKDDGKLNNP